MAITTSFISLIIPVKNVEKAYPGGLERYKSDNPHIFNSERTFYDGTLICDRIVMGPYLEERVKEWGDWGLTGLGRRDSVTCWVDFAIVDRFGGATRLCPWLKQDEEGDFYYVDWDGMVLPDWDPYIFDQERAFAKINRDHELKDELCKKLFHNNLRLFKKDTYRKYLHFNPFGIGGDDGAPEPAELKTVMLPLSPINRRGAIVRTFSEIFPVNAGASYQETQVVITARNPFCILENTTGERDRTLYVYDQLCPSSYRYLAYIEDDLFTRTDYVRHLLRLFPDSRFSDAISTPFLFDEDGNDVEFAPGPDHVEKERQEYELTRFVLQKNITVFRNGSDRGYDLLDHPFKADVLSLTRMIHPDCVFSSHGEPEPEDHVKRILGCRIRSVFQMALLHGYRRLVLSDFGCSTRNISAYFMANLFKGILSEPEFRNCFAQLIFCIPPDLTNFDEDYFPTDANISEIFKHAFGE